MKPMQLSKSTFRVSVLSVALAAITVSGCATKEDVSRVEDRVFALEKTVNETRGAVRRVDSLTQASASNKGEYAQLQSMIDALNVRLEQLTNQVSELQNRMAYNASGASQTATIQSGDDSNADSGTSGIDCTKLYDDSFIQIRQGDYESALTGFKEYLQYCGTGEMADNAQYWIAEASYARKDFSGAATEYQKLVNTYPNSEKMPTALFKLGRCSEELKQPSKALDYYQQVVARFPSSQEGELAKDKVTELKGAAANRGG